MTEDCRTFGVVPDYDSPSTVRRPRIIALLSWYMEDPAWLTELTVSLARAGVDHIVAVDGAYAAYPHAAGSSGSEQACMVVAAALGAGVGVTVHIPRWPWKGNELEKRTFLFAAGHLVARPDIDWLWVIDGDEVVTEAAGLLDALASTDRQVATCTLWEGVTSGEHQWNSQPLRMLFRAQRSGIHVRDYHACYVTGDGAFLWHSTRPVDEVPALDLPHVKVRHRPGDRPRERNDARLAYYDRAVADKLERF